MPFKCHNCLSNWWRDHRLVPDYRLRILRFARKAFLITSIMANITLLGCKYEGYEPAPSSELGDDSKDCTPLLLLVGPKEGIEVRDATGGVVFRPIISGCARDLNALDEGSIKLVANLLKLRVEEDIDKAGAKRGDRPYRSELSTLINNELKAEIVTDVYLSDYFQWEARKGSPN